jgi:hypothetical protein
MANKIDTTGVSATFLSSHLIPISRSYAGRFRSFVFPTSTELCFVVPVG